MPPKRCMVACVRHGDWPPSRCSCRARLPASRKASWPRTPIAGKLTRLDIVAGGVLLRARVIGEGVELGRVGRHPIGQAARNLQLNLDWRPPWIDGLSLDVSATHWSRRAATRDNLVFLPARTLVDLGGRYRFKLAGRPASIRVRATNLFDVYGFDLRGSGAYDTIPGRVLSGALAMDF
ncbi:MAG: TonB-dependent receptor [Pseudomonadota bacterium]|nr:TonB-dependent receptor [Pseudomonadota bacterium]